MKIIRPGNTETILSFLYYVEKYHFDKLDLEQKKYLKSKKLYFITWLYQTAGYYDKERPINRIERQMYTINDETNNLKSYVGDLTNGMKNTFIIYIQFTSYIEKSCLSIFWNSFVNYLNPNIINITFFNTITSVKQYLINKKILIISPFKTLMENQISNNNFKHIYCGLHDDLTFIFYSYPYKFFNNGPHNNNNETLNNIYKDLDNIDYDISIMSCGADSIIIADYNEKNNKDSICLGGHIPTWFGIIGKRYSKNYYEYIDNNDIEKYLIFDIPNEYKPNNYLQIENGCYW